MIAIVVYCVLGAIGLLIAAAIGYVAFVDRNGAGGDDPAWPRVRVEVHRGQLLDITPAIERRRRREGR